MAEVADTLQTQLADAVRSSANGDGGWGYLSGKATRLEPTCWALLALTVADRGRADDGRDESALALFAAWQGESGLLSDTPGAFPNFAFNGLAAIAIHPMMSTRHWEPGQSKPGLEALRSAIQAGAGVRFGRSWVSRQDNELAGWPWHDGTSSWVEPTAWCALALKKTAPAPIEASAAARVAEAERMLADRCCHEGGWNYGNSNMLGKELLPYVPTSALALLALQDHPAQPEVVRGLSWLAANWRRESSTLALPLALIAMSVYRESTDEIERSLRACLAAAGPPDNLAARALALYALTGRRHGYAALSL